MLNSAPTLLEQESHKHIEIFFIWVQLLIYIFHKKGVWLVSHQFPMWVN